jgi:hypothetical protein
VYEAASRDATVTERARLGPTAGSQREEGD